MTAYEGQSGGRRRSYESIYEEIRDRISLLRYPPGTLLTENELATEFGVSRTPVRRALQRLEFEGLVESRHGVGTLVTTVELRELREVYALRLRLYEIVADFSSVALARADDLATLDDLVARVEAMRGQRNDRDNQVELTRLYTRFNAIMLRTISNRALRRIVEQLFYQTSRIWLQILPDLAWDEEVTYFRDEVVDVVRALREDDIHRAVQVRRQHMLMLLNRIRRYLGALDLPS